MTVDRGRLTRWGLILLVGLGIGTMGASLIVRGEVRGWITAAVDSVTAIDASGDLLHDGLLGAADTTRQEVRELQFRVDSLSSILRDHIAGDDR